MARYICAVLITLSFAASGASPEQVVQEFYRWRIHPNAQEIELNRAGKWYEAGHALFSLPLAKALEAQRHYQSACARLSPGEKPWMIDQDIFFHWPDGAKALDSTKVGLGGNVAYVAANLSHDEYKWTDRVTLRRAGKRWAIVEIDWQDGSTLTRRLVEFASYRCDLNQFIQTDIK